MESGHRGCREGVRGPSGTDVVQVQECLALPWRNHIEEIMTENFLNLGKETDTQVQEAQRVSNKMN